MVIDWEAAVLEIGRNATPQAQHEPFTGRTEPVYATRHDAPPTVNDPVAQPKLRLVGKDTAPKSAGVSYRTQPWP